VELSLLGAAAIAVAVVNIALRGEALLGTATEGTRSLFDVALTSVVVGLGVGRLGAMLGDGVNPLAHPGDFLIVRGGVATGWASLAAMATAAVVGRSHLWAVLDGISVAGVAGLAGWHAGCLVRHACLGTPSQLPWAMTQPGSTITRHPVELYAALALALLAVGLAVWRRYRSPATGTAAAFALAGAALVRLLTEPLRPALGSGPVGWYLAGLVAGATALVWRWRVARLAGTAPPLAG